MRTDDAFAGHAGPLLDAVAMFEELGIGYALIGGVAAMIYGRQRPTKDIDFVAVTGHDHRLQQHADAMRRHHFDPSCTRNLYHGSGVEIDLWKDEHADGIVSRAGRVELMGRQVRIADPHDLVAMKLRADRPVDDYDISEMLRHMPLDESTIASRVTNEQLERFRAIRSRVSRG